MSRPKFAARVVDQVRLASILSVVGPESGVVGPESGVVEPVMSGRDPGDAIVVAAAIGAMADLIVTGDRDLLGDGHLVHWLGTRSIEVITPAELVRRLNSGPPAAR